MLINPNKLKKPYRDKILRDRLAKEYEGLKKASREEHTKIMIDESEEPEKPTEEPEKGCTELQDGKKDNFLW